MVNQKTWLIAAAAVLVVGRIIASIYASWGLVTIHAEKQPLSKVIGQIRKQGHIKFETDLDPATSVTMHVVKVPLTDALDTLAAVTDSRWRLRYVLAPDKSAINVAIANLVAGTRPADWKLVDHPIPQMFVGEDEPIPDPRQDLWEVKKPDDGSLASYLEGAARATNAGFLFPENWNPTIKSPPRSAEITRVIPKLASAAGGKYEELYMLLKPQRRDWQREQAQQPDDAERERRRQWMAERAQDEINKLPPERRAEAQAEFDKQRAFWQEVRNLPPEQRRAKMEEFFNDPKNQERREDRQASRDAKRTPEQRFQRYQGYVQQKMAAQAAAGKR
jgi:hypothetical protein